MGADPEPGGLGGKRDTAGQCRDRWAKLSAKLVREVVALAGVSMPEAGVQQQRAGLQLRPTPKELALDSAGQGRKGEVA